MIKAGFLALSMAILIPLMTTETKGHGFWAGFGGFGCHGVAVAVPACVVPVTACSHAHVHALPACNGCGGLRAHWRAMRTVRLAQRAERRAYRAAVRAAALSCHGLNTHASCAGSCAGTSCAGEPEEE